MPHPDHIKYRGVPDDVSRIAANACWEFIDKLDALAKEIEEFGETIANVRLSADPAEWQRRLKKGAAHVKAMPVRIERLGEYIEKMSEHLPMPNHPDNDPSNWVGDREFNPEIHMGCDDLECNVTGEINADGWTMDPNTDLIYCFVCAEKRGLL